VESKPIREQYPILNYFHSIQSLVLGRRKEEKKEKKKKKKKKKSAGKEEREKMKYNSFTKLLPRPSHTIVL